MAEGTSTPTDVMALAKDAGAQIVDLRFCDLPGLMQHFSVPMAELTEDRYGPIPEPVENLLAIQTAKLKLARLGADYLVYRGGRATVGPLSLGSIEVRALRDAAPTVIYSTEKREVSLRVESLEAALGLPDAIVDVRLAA